jgi:FixJ family two-component response regulator
MLAGVQGTTMDIYINGVLGESIASNVNVSTNTVNLGRYQGSTRQLNGNVAQTLIYNRVLTAQEIQQNFNATRGRFGI